AKKIHEFVMSLEDARDFTVNLTGTFDREGLIAKREEMIREVSARVPSISEAESRKKLTVLFGGLADEYFKDEALVKHRAEHGGIDIF
ncbi:MAG: hypothetical protein ABIJ27_02695, partial [Candidatus Omnitrophota bacterium]